MGKPSCVNGVCLLMCQSSSVSRVSEIDIWSQKAWRVLGLHCSCSTDFNFKLVKVVMFAFNCLITLPFIFCCAQVFCLFCTHFFKHFWLNILSVLIFLAFWNHVHSQIIVRKKSLLIGWLDCTLEMNKEYSFPFFFFAC